MVSAILTVAADFFCWVGIAGLILFFINKASIKRNPENNENEPEE
jgi:hypothetical protein